MPIEDYKRGVKLALNKRTAKHICVALSAYSNELADHVVNAKKRNSWREAYEMQDVLDDLFNFTSQLFKKFELGDADNE